MGNVEDNGPWLDKFHAMHPDKPLGVSEYGAENILMWHTAEPDNHDYTEEYSNYYHQKMLKTFAARPYLWATHQWNCFDFAADARNEGGVKGRNNKGLITYDRKEKKDAFYVYKAWWNPEPMVFVSETFKSMMAGAGGLMGGGMEMGESMKEFMNMMRLNDMLKMTGPAFPADAKLALNEALTKVKK